MCKICWMLRFRNRFGNIGIEFTSHILYITRDKTFVYSKCFRLRPFINCTCVEIIEISNTLTRTVIRKTDCTYIKLQNSFPVLVCYDRQQTCGVKYVWMGLDCRFQAVRVVFNSILLLMYYGGCHLSQFILLQQQLNVY